MGKTQSDETKQKISESKKGKISNRINFKHTEEQKEKWSKSRSGINHNPNYTKHSMETKQKMKDYIAINGSARSKKCQINDIIYINAKTASLMLNIKYSKVLYKLNSSNWLNWTYL